MVPKFYRKVLKNGLTVIFEKRTVPVVSVAIGVKNGGINEMLHEKGISHFIEHMLYKGTPTRNAKQIAHEIEKNGGDLNGFTSETLTAYWCKMPSKKLQVALEVLSDMVKNPLFDEKELDKERKVIFEEIKMYRDNPRLHIFDGIHFALFKEPFGVPLIGTQKTMSSIDRKRILEKFREVYQPNNMILAVVGDASFDKIIKFAEKTFGNEKGRIPKIKVENRNMVKVEKRKGIDQANLVFAHHVPSSKDKNNYAAQVLITLLAGGMSSRLFSEIREKRNLAYSIKGDSSITKWFGYNFVYVGTKKENVAEVKRLILEELKKVSENLGEKELKETKEQMIGNYQISMEDSQAHLVQLLMHEADGNAKDFFEYEKNVKQVKAEDVKEIARKALKEYSFYALVPEK